MSLLQTFLPEHQFSEQHHIRVNAPPARVLDMASQLDVKDFPVARLFLHLRAIPARIAVALGRPSARRIDAGFGLHDFTALGRNGDHEFALGLVGRFWEAAGGLIHVEASAFHTFCAPDIAKLVMTFVAEPVGTGTLLTTRTCVHCCSTKGAPALHALLDTGPRAKRADPPDDAAADQAACRGRSRAAYTSRITSVPALPASTLCGTPAGTTYSSPRETVTASSPMRRRSSPSITSRPSA